MFILGLTGSIGMGKSNAAATLRRLGLPLHDSDAAVHRLIGPGGSAVGAVGAAFPGVVKDGAVDRTALGRMVFGDAAALVRLEGILHPRVRRATLDFLRCQARAHQSLVVLDIPLLYETGGDVLCDAVVVVSAPARLQRLRVLRRPGMTEARFARILAQQMNDHEKQRRADFVVQTGLGKRDTLRQLRAIVTLVKGRRGHAWPPRTGARAVGRRPTKD